MRAKILVVEDQDDLRMILADLLTAHGHEVFSAGTLSEAWEHAVKSEIDLCILDVMLPDGDGFSLCQRLRAAGFDGGVLMLTARSEVADRIEGLEKGADDYLVKPFDGNELLARVHALLRRMNKAAWVPLASLHFGDVLVDFQDGSVSRRGQRVNLAAKEFQLLRYLVENRGQVLSRERLLENVWKQQPFITPRTVDTHIAWLRQKLEADPQNPQYILTVRGEGYKFDR